MLPHPGTAIAACAALAFGLLFTSCAEAGTPDGSGGGPGGGSATAPGGSKPAAPIVPTQRGGNAEQKLPPEEPHAIRDTDFVEVEVAPRIVDLQPTSVRFAWITRKASTGKLALTGPSGTTEIDEPTSAPRRHHVVDVNDLEPLTTYAYTVDGRFSGSIVTPGIDEPFTFAVFGHPGGTTAPHTFPARALAGTFESLDPSFLLCTGDVCYFTAEHSFKRLYFDVFRDILARKPIYLTAANHEAGFPPSQGTGYGTFRKLFPYDYPSKAHAYHSFRRGNIEFFAFAYGPMTKALASEQLAWLADALANSRAEFRIVYLGGGQNPTNFDRTAFFRTAREGGADLVFGGDGVRSKETQVDGLDFFFAGSNEKSPMDFYYARSSPYALEVSKYDATLNGLRGAWNFETRRPKVTVFDALPLGKRSKINGAVQFIPIGLKSSDFHGVKLTLRNPLKRRAPYWLRWSTASTTGGGDYYFRTDTRWLEVGETRTNYFELPPLNPVSGKPWILKELDVRTGYVEMPDNLDLRPYIEELVVFRDPLR